MLLIALNLLFFGGMLVGSLLVGFGGIQLYDPGAHVLPTDGNLLSLVPCIFFFNLVLSAFVVVTLAGLVFFLLAAGFLLLRALVWGALITTLSTSEFLFALPTLVLEGEAYVLAALAGVVLGLSWLKPEWAYRGKGLSRLEAFKWALRECAYIYVLVVIILLVSAVVEAVTILLW